jgi:hypothetical protein
LRGGRAVGVAVRLGSIGVAVGEKGATVRVGGSVAGPDDIGVTLRAAPTLAVDD